MAYGSSCQLHERARSADHTAADPSSGVSKDMQQDVKPTPFEGVTAVIDSAQKHTRSAVEAGKYVTHVFHLTWEGGGG